jgi:hypothetical protein
MKPSERHRWVRLFLDAMIDAPKKLWRPTIVVVDEAHQFAPEKGHGESETSEAMIGLATRGRKRGFAAVFATQRLGKLRKDVAAELLNVLIGQTFIDIDRKRAADALGVPAKEERAFFDQVKVLEPGTFWGLGRAIATERILLEVGPVETTHPEPGSARHAAAPPPAPGKVKALLPKLQDLPREAEQEAQDRATLRAEVGRLKRELAVAQRAQPPPPKPLPAPKVEVKTVPALKKGEIRRVEAIADRVEKVADRLKLCGVVWSKEGERLVQALRATQEVSARAIRAQDRPALPPVRPATQPARATGPPAPREAPRQRQETARGQDGDLTGPEQRILDSVAWLESLGQQDADQAAAAFLAGYTIGGGAWNNPRGALHTKGLVAYRPGGRIALTDSGRALARVPETPLTTQELHGRVMERLPGPERKLLRVLLEAYPTPISNEDLAAKAGYADGGGAFNNPRGRLRSLGLIDYPDKGMVVARPLLFLEG